tara:strand:- start:252 stop:599 length:348 start_codon:yes stop_codon:yes gene_type:complete
MIKYQKFKNLLKKHEINLFDDEYRLIFDNMGLLEKICNDENKISKNIIKKKSKIQVGGDYEDLLSPFYILGKSFQNEDKSIIFSTKLKMVIENLNNSNFEGAKFICKKNFYPKII